MPIFEGQLRSAEQRRREAPSLTEDIPPAKTVVLCRGAWTAHNRMRNIDDLDREPIRILEVSARPCDHVGLWMVSTRLM